MHMIAPPALLYVYYRPSSPFPYSFNIPAMDCCWGFGRFAAERSPLPMSTALLSSKPLTFDDQTEKAAAHNSVPPKGVTALPIRASPAQRSTGVVVRSSGHTSIPWLHAEGSFVSSSSSSSNSSASFIHHSLPTLELCEDRNKNSSNGGGEGNLRYYGTPCAHSAHWKRLRAKRVSTNISPSSSSNSISFLFSIFQLPFHPLIKREKKETSHIWQFSHTHTHTYTHTQIHKAYP